MQIATEGQYTLAYGIYSNSTDTKTLIPFLYRIENQFFSLPNYIVADAGYGSEQNYDDILTNRDRTPLITYNHYLNEQKKKYKNDPFKTSNWIYDEKEMPSLAQTTKRSGSSIIPYVPIKQGFNDNIKCTNVKIVQGAPYALSVRKQKKVPIVKFL